MEETIRASALKEGNALLADVQASDTSAEDADTDAGQNEEFDASALTENEVKSLTTAELVATSATTLYHNAVEVFVLILLVPLVRC